MQLGPCWVRRSLQQPSRQAQENLRIASGETVNSVMQRVRHVTGRDTEVLNPAIPIEPGRVANTTTPAYKASTESILHTDPTAVIAPGLFAGHSDSIWFEPIAANAYRFLPLRLRPADPPLLHGIDERIAVSTNLDMIRFNETLIERAF